MSRYGERGEVNIDDSTQISLGCDGCPNQCRILAPNHRLGMTAINIIAHSFGPLNGQVPYKLHEEHILTVHNKTVEHMTGDSSYNPYPMDGNGTCTQPCKFTAQQMANVGAFFVEKLEESAQGLGVRLACDEYILDELRVKDKTER